MGSRAGAREVVRSLGAEGFVGAMHTIAAGHLDVAPLHTGTFGLSSLTRDSREARSGDSEHTKVLIAPME